MKILVYSKPGAELTHLSEAVKTRLQQRVQETGNLLVFTENHDHAVSDIADTDILFGFITQEMLQNAQQLKWIIFFPHSKTATSS
jgi:phosphoglycerate dehydrogenase-like enzyme